MIFQNIEPLSDYDLPSQRLTGIAPVELHRKPGPPFLASKTTPDSPSLEKQVKAIATSHKETVIEIIHKEQKETTTTVDSVENQDETSESFNTAQPLPEVDFSQFSLIFNKTTALKIKQFFDFYETLPSASETIEKARSSLIEFMYQKATGYANTHNDTTMEKPFHFYGFNYCGPGTNLKYNLENNVEPINEMDRVCMQHDIDYASVRLPSDVFSADIKGEQGVRNLLSNNPEKTEWLWASVGYIAYAFKRSLEKLGILSPVSFTNIRKLTKLQMNQLDQKIEDLLEEALGVLSLTD